MTIPSPIAGTGLAQAQSEAVSGRFTLRGPDGSEATIGELRSGFSQGFVFELIDITKPEALEVHVMVLNPRVYNLSEPFQLTLTPTAGDTVNSEQQGIIVREIALEGTYGLIKKRAEGFQGVQGGGAALSGTEHFTALRNLFRRYSALKKDASQAPNIRMIFHALRSDDHFTVEPRTFDTPRDAARTRVHYDYRITLAGIGPAEESRLRPKDDPLSIGDPLQEISRALSDARAAYADVIQKVAVAQRKVANIATVLRQAAQFINQTGAFVTGVTDLITYPIKSVGALADVVSQSADQLASSSADLVTGSSVFYEAQRTLFRLEASINRIALFPEKFQATAATTTDPYRGEKNLTQADIQGLTAGATIGSRVRVAYGSEGSLDSIYACTTASSLYASRGPTQSRDWQRRTTQHQKRSPF